ncbi:4-alpha-L-fucosyltransferase (Fuc4NAc transferase) [Idiomarina tyrosinivorans]|uniref:4-alpha-L-fucosyltransferase (Fuc4NAc transferase) n=1 Tax=Idiomarina tyrosinivorans TaxID=1445662 RepID=A0A432ZQQ3_9GAMM|nr:TDP-N-acetylfucosamine:lipid II N-acetylfucosaminyltransferase [Idiomarina tyrosinivorans]RUO80265.1 4-alpha-L-fucosyltransferase (Fuc4NAc transferase) [Idiomarina tyrosinivorans]
MKILHLATDSKFIDHASLLFEKAFPESNDIYIFSRSKKLKYVNQSVDKIIKPNRILKRPTLNSHDYAEYDVIVFHSLSGLLCLEVFSIPGEIPTIWFGWGYDYYDLITSQESLLLAGTHKLKNNVRKKSYVSFIVRTFRTVFEKLKINKTKTAAIEKITLFSPVLPQEYDLVKKSMLWKKFPEYCQWNYGTIEDNFVRGYENTEIDSNSVLVGNSASSTNNHLEALSLLRKLNVTDRDVVVPLSYGNKEYGNRIKQLGYELFDKKFFPLIDFMPVDDYVRVIKKCGFVIMNHKRQQAVGNIVIMFYFGARIFLREENPAYIFFKENGLVLSSVQELEKDPLLIGKPLSLIEKRINRRLIVDYWCRKKGIERTKDIVKRAIKLSLQLNKPVKTQT